MPPRRVQEKACVVPSAVCALPITSPESLTAVATLLAPPSVPRSTSPPRRVQMNARISPPAVSASPTTMPASLTAFASLFAPPNVPRSTMPSRCVHENARVSLYSPSLFTSADQPTTWPESLMAVAALLLPPGSVPRSIALAALVVGTGVAASATGVAATAVASDTSAAAHIALRALIPALRILPRVSVRRPFASKLPGSCHRCKPLRRLGLAFDDVRPTLNDGVADVAVAASACGVCADACACAYGPGTSPPYAWTAHRDCPCSGCRPRPTRGSDSDGKTSCTTRSESRHSGRRARPVQGRGR